MQPLPHGITIRRATLDDLEVLRGVWREFGLVEHELEKRFTEFQLAVDAHGWILATLALRFTEHQGQVHSLTVRRTDLSRELTSALWDRTLALAEQHGAYRLWTRERGDFWGSVGFLPSVETGTPEAPLAFGGGRHWLTLKLREEPLKLIAAEEQLEAYLELERLKTDQMVRRVQVLKILAVGAAIVLFVVTMGALLMLVRRNRRPPPPPQP